MDPELDETCRHIDELGESVRSDLCAVGKLMDIWIEKMDRRIDQQDARIDRLEGRVLRLETRVFSLEDDRKPRRVRRHR